jgi:hypothetical protein
MVEINVRSDKQNEKSNSYEPIYHASATPTILSMSVNVNGDTVPDKNCNANEHAVFIEHMFCNNYY